MNDPQDKATPATSPLTPPPPTDPPNTQAPPQDERLSPLQRHRRWGLRVTDMSAQVWCEQQLAFTLTQGRPTTEAMRQGRERHQALHEEITEIVEVRPTTPEEHWALTAFNAWAALQQLRLTGLCREIPVFGKLHNTWFVGIIDQLEHPAHHPMVLLSDTKTRRSPRMPSEAQKRTTRLQMMLYYRLFEKTACRGFFKDEFYEDKRLDPAKPLGEAYLAEMKASGFPVDTLDQMLDLTIEAFVATPQLDPTMLVRYEYQQDQHIIGEDRFSYQRPRLERQIDHGLKFWMGEREAQGVRARESWKCRYCHFIDQCQKTPLPSAPAKPD